MSKYSTNLMAFLLIAVATSCNSQSHLSTKDSKCQDRDSGQRLAEAKLKEVSPGAKYRLRGHNDDGEWHYFHYLGVGEFARPGYNPVISVHMESCEIVYHPGK